MTDQESMNLLKRVRDQDSDAAMELFHRYLNRLIALVRTRLSNKLARRLDPEDVVQSAYRSFFTAAQDGRFELQRSGDLWRLLAAITINKLGKQVERHTAAKRDYAAEQAIDSADASVRAVQPELLARDPTPAEATMLVEQVELLMSDFDEVQRKMLEMRLAGHTVGEIADEINRSERTVRRLLDKVKDKLQHQLEEWVE